MQEDICSPGDILAHADSEASIAPLARTLSVLLTHATPHAKDIAQYDLETLELNYQRQLRRYSDERFISNFNTPENFIDETEEYQLNYENNNTDSPVNYSPIYEVRNRGPYYQTNRVQFVSPFCNVLKSDSLEIYDTDEVDFPMEVGEREIQTEVERYDREKMNLDIQNNLNAIENEPTEVVNKMLFTCLCLGAFVVSTIILIAYPL